VRIAGCCFLCFIQAGQVGGWVRLELTSNLERLLHVIIQLASHYIDAPLNWPKMFDLSSRHKPVGETYPKKKKYIYILYGWWRYLVQVIYIYIFYLFLNRKRVKHEEVMDLKLQRCIKWSVNINKRSPKRWNQ
jgi:hypothetical protein